MAQQPEEILDLFSKSEELVELFRKGRAFTEELMSENERLRYRVVQLETEKLDFPETLVKEIERLKFANSQLAQRIEFLDSRFREVESENKDFALRYVEVEEQNESLANLYVASYRLHSTLDPSEVIGCIKEILVNLIGTEEFALLVVDDETDELVVAGYEGEIAHEFAQGQFPAGVGPEAEVARSGRRFFSEESNGDGTFACVPLKIKDRVVGVIAIYKLLSHKTGLTALDHRLLDLLAGHAATALVSSKLYAHKDRKLRTIEGVMSLLRSK